MTPPRHLGQVPVLEIVTGPTRKSQHCSCWPLSFCGTARDGPCCGSLDGTMMLVLEVRMRKGMISPQLLHTVDTRRAAVPAGREHGQSSQGTHHRRLLHSRTQLRTVRYQCIELLETRPTLPYQHLLSWSRRRLPSLLLLWLEPQTLPEAARDRTGLQSAEAAGSAATVLSWLRSRRVRLSAPAAADVLVKHGSSLVGKKAFREWF